MDFLRKIRSFKHEKNWEEEKLLVNSVPKSSIINKSHEYKSSYKSDSSSFAL